MSKQFMLKILIVLSIMVVITYLSTTTAEAVPVPQDSMYEPCLDLRADLISLFLRIDYYKEVMDVSKYIDIFNYNVVVFNDICTPMMTPLEEIPS
jgi:hypothetical protein